MAYFGQGIVLGADGNMERTVACSRAKGGGETANTCLHLQTGIGEDLGDPAAGLLFGKAQFRVVVNAMREIDQGLLIGVYGFLSLLLGVHECFPSRLVLFISWEMTYHIAGFDPRAGDLGYAFSKQTFHKGEPYSCQHKAKWVIVPTDVPTRHSTLRR